MWNHHRYPPPHTLVPLLLSVPALSKSLRTTSRFSRARHFIAATWNRNDRLTPASLRTAAVYDTTSFQQLGSSNALLDRPDRHSGDRRRPRHVASVKTIYNARNNTVQTINKPLAMSKEHVVKWIEGM